MYSNQEGQNDIDVDTRFQQIFVKISVGKVLEAAQEFQKAYMEADKDNARGITFYLDRIRSYRSCKDIEDIIAILDKYINETQMDSNILILRAGIKFIAKRYVDSIKDFNNTLLLDWFGYYLRGMSKYKLGMYEQAIEDFDVVIKLYDKYIPAYNMRGNAKYRLARYEDALEDYDKVTTQSQDCSVAYINIGDIYCLLGKDEEAIKSYDKAISINAKCGKHFKNIKLDKKIILFIAVKNGCTMIVNELMKGNMSLQDVNLEELLLMAIENEHIEILKLLIKKAGESTKIKDKYVCTMLYKAAQDSKIEGIRALIDNLFIEDTRQIREPDDARVSKLEEENMKLQDSVNRQEEEIRRLREMVANLARQGQLTARGKVDGNMDPEYSNVLGIER